MSTAAVVLQNSCLQVPLNIQQLHNQVLLAQQLAETVSRLEGILTPSFSSASGCGYRAHGNAELWFSLFVTEYVLTAVVCVMIRSEHVGRCISGLLGFVPRA